MYEELKAYVENQVLGASPARLIEMLYDRACRDLASAVELMTLQGDARTMAEATRCIIHAQQIVAQLNSSLNLQKGGELAITLHRLYEYIQYRLTEAVNTRQKKPVQEALELLGELHETWDEMTENAEGTSRLRSEARNLVV